MALQTRQLEAQSCLACDYYSRTEFKLQVMIRRDFTREISLEENLVSLQFT
jgi:hypothetical protein